MIGVVIHDGQFVHFRVAGDMIPSLQKPDGHGLFRFGGIVVPGLQPDHRFRAAGGNQHAARIRHRIVQGRARRPPKGVLHPQPLRRGRVHEDRHRMDFPLDHPARVRRQGNREPGVVVQHRHGGRALRPGHRVAARTASIHRHRHRTVRLVHGVVHRVHGMGHRAGNRHGHPPARAHGPRGRVISLLRHDQVHRQGRFRGRGSEQGEDRALSLRDGIPSRDADFRENRGRRRGSGRGGSASAAATATTTTAVIVGNGQRVGGRRARVVVGGVGERQHHRLVGFLITVVGDRHRYRRGPLARIHGYAAGIRDAEIRPRRRRAAHGVAQRDGRLRRRAQVHRHAARPGGLSRPRSRGGEPRHGRGRRRRRGVVHHEGVVVAPRGRRLDQRVAARVLDV